MSYPNAKPEFWWETGVYESDARPYDARRHNPAGNNECTFATLIWNEGVAAFGFVRRVAFGQSVAPGEAHDAHIHATVKERGTHHFGTKEEAQTFIQKAYDEATSEELWEYIDGPEMWRFDKRYGN